MCTANITRSPLAEVILDAHVRVRGLDELITVDSAGVHARPGQPADPPSATLATEAGLDLSRHRSRHTDDVEVAGTDLVLTMTEEHRDLLAGRTPGLGPRAFTLTEAVRLLTGADTTELAALPPGPDRLRAAVRLAHRQRPISPAPEAAEDVADPHGRSDPHYRRMAGIVAGTIEHLAVVILGPR